MTQKPEYNILWAFVGILLFHAIMIGITALDGVYHMPFWIFGILLFIVFFALAYFYRSRLKELPIFLGLLYFLICVYPTLAYILYMNNVNNYEFSESFLENELSFINEKFESEIPLKDLKRIRTYLDTAKFVYDRKYIEIPERYNFDNVLVGYTGKWLLTISKNDSVKTEILYRMVDPELEQNSILDGIDREIAKFQRLVEFKNLNTYDVPYSEFWIEAVMGFRYGDIKPARNIPKILNALPLICYLLLGTILVKYSLENNEVQKKKSKKKKKKKGYKNDN
ncbi:MAG: hypothetical protein VX798_11835 [Bacteroidota bacterium]|nr:hypothetical protein [Bacteroidota bacterium]